jgi:hypothetical protein
MARSISDSQSYEQTRVCVDIRQEERGNRPPVANGQGQDDGCPQSGGA